eukprot:SAG25_NODE_240_length_11194_cov_5.215322_6_plen_98_part_00
MCHPSLAREGCHKPVGLPAALALLALPWYGWFGNPPGRTTRPPLQYLPPLPRSPSTEHRAGLSSVGGAGLMTCPSYTPIMVELGVAVDTAAMLDARA